MTSSDLRDLYQEVIIDHSRQPRNFRKIENATKVVEGYNPLCGDHLKLYVLFENDRVQDVAFEGSGCAISKASASLMGGAIKGKTTKEAQELLRDFHHLVTARMDEKTPSQSLGKLMVFSGVREFPSRVKCAMLPWRTLEASLCGVTPSVVSTEENETVAANE